MSTISTNCSNNMLLNATCFVVQSFSSCTCEATSWTWRMKMQQCLNVEKAWCGVHLLMLCWGTDFKLHFLPMLGKWESKLNSSIDGISQQVGSILWVKTSTHPHGSASLSVMTSGNGAGVRWQTPEHEMECAGRQRREGTAVSGPSCCFLFSCSPAAASALHLPSNSGPRLLLI